MLIYFILIPVGFYLVVHLPLLLLKENAFSITGLIRNHINVLFRHAGASDYHDYASPWWQWPLMKKAVWFYYDMESGTNAKMINFLMNPFLVWAGNIAVLFGLWFGLKKKDHISILMLLGFASTFLFWAIIGRSQTFQYYYVLPLIFKTILLMYVFGLGVSALKKNHQYLLVSGLVVILSAPFIYFYPIISAKRITFPEYKSRMWIDSWGLIPSRPRKN